MQLNDSRSLRRLLALFSVTVTTVSCVLVLSGSNAFAQNSSQTIEQSATYVSQMDADLTLRRVSVLPVSDNVDGIYARPIESQLISLVKDAHRWDYVEAKIDSAMPSVGELEEKSDSAKKVSAGLDAEAFFVASASRGANGLTLRLDLFLKKDGKLLSQDIVKDLPRFETAEVREQIKAMYKKVVSKLPYQGLILSRQNNRITINLGKSDGLVKDQTVTAIQIISIQRHPKFNFLVSSDKEILGRIKILKVDDSLSFGAIVSEKERGAIARFAKISALEDVNYGEPSGLNPETDRDVRNRADAGVAFGKDAREWIPAEPPSFGQVGLTLGLGSFGSTSNLEGSDCCEAKTAIYPSLSVQGELWINPKWAARLELTQGVISMDNPREGSSPGELNSSYSRYALMLGYNFLLQDDFFGPKIQLNLGLGTARAFVDDSQPRALTTTSFSGGILGINGLFPVTDDKQWFAGGKFNLYLFPSMTESPVKSAAGNKASINEFSIFVQKKLGENLRAIGSLDVTLYSANFTGGPGSRTDAATGNPETATSLSQRHTVLNAGVLYMF